MILVDNLIPFKKIFVNIDLITQKKNVKEGLYHQMDLNIESLQYLNTYVKLYKL